MDALILFNSFNYPVLSEYNGYFLDIVAKIAIKHNLVCFAGSGDVTSDSGISRSTKVPASSNCGKKSTLIPKDLPSKHCNSFDASDGSLIGGNYSRDYMRRVLVSDREQFNSVIQLILAPYVASVRVYKEKCNMSNLLFDTVKTTRIYFTEYLDHIVLHIGDSSGAEVKHARKAQRKIHYFTEILKFTFGSNLSTARSDDRQSALAISLYRTWITSQTSPVYLIEATERLLVSYSIKSTFTMILQAILSLSRDFLKNFGEIPILGLLYENGKLVADYSTQPSGRLSRKDMVLVQLLVEGVISRHQSPSQVSPSGTSSTHFHRHSSQNSNDISFIASPLGRRYARFNSFPSPPDQEVIDDEEQSYFGDTEDAFGDEVSPPPPPPSAKIHSGVKSSVTIHVSPSGTPIKSNSNLSYHQPQHHQYLHHQQNYATSDIHRPSTPSRMKLESPLESRGRSTSLYNPSTATPLASQKSTSTTTTSTGTGFNSSPSKHHRHHRHFSSVQLELTDLISSSYCCANSRQHSPFVVDQSRANSQLTNAFLLFLEPLTRSSANASNSASFSSSYSSFSASSNASCPCANLRLPYCLRVLRVTSSLVLVTVSELSTRFVARSIHVILDTFSKLLYSRTTDHPCPSLHQMTEFERACTHLHRIFENSPKNKLLAERLLSLVESNQVKKFFHKSLDLPLKLDALASSLSSTLRDLYHEMVYSFEQCRISKVSHLEQVQLHHASCQALIRERASLYLEYISVKSMINMRLDPYVTLIPGLKGFVYIDRKFNCVIHALASQPKMKEIMVTGLNQAYSKLMTGQLTSEFLKDKFSLCYLMWFEDDKGNTIKPLTNNFTLTHYPCLMSNFVDEIIDKCFLVRPTASSSNSASLTQAQLAQRRRDLSKSAISVYELLVIVKRSNKKTTDESIASDETYMDQVKFHRLANKLSEFLAPEHVSACLC